MSLDNLDRANTAHWTIYAPNDWVLSTLKDAFEQRGGISAASLTKETLNVSLEIKDADTLQTVQELKDKLRSMEGLFGMDVISQHIPNVSFD